MKANRVFNVIFGIALFAAFVGMVTCLYNAIDMFTYTTFSPFYNSSTKSLEVSEVYNELQKPLATVLLVASIISLVGVVAAGLGLFCKKTVVKAISLTASVVVALSFIGFMIWAYNVWFSYLKDCEFYSSAWFNIVDVGIPFFISSFKRYSSISGYIYYDGQVAQYALYSTVMSALLQQLIYFAVVAGTITYYFVRPIIETKRNKKVQAEVESTETVSAEVEENQNN